MAFSRFNALDQSLDIKGSTSFSSTRTLTEETAGLGSPLAGQAGAAASITEVVGGLATVAGLTLMSSSSVGNFLTLGGAAPNGGTFLIVELVGASSVKVSNAAAVVAAGPFAWTERRPYSLNDDLDFERTDRAAIKGAAFDAVIPNYQRPTALGTNVPANLTNIAGKTTDAQGFIFTRKYNGAAVAATNTFITVTSAGNLKHADSVDKTGVPCYDVDPYTGNELACYVEILNEDGEQLVVQATGATEGDKIFGLSRDGGATSPNSIEVAFFSVPFGEDISGTITPYAWEAGQPTTVDLFYGYFQRLDQADENAFRTISSLGVEESGTLREDVNNLQAAVGVGDGDTFLDGLTNTGNFFPFVTVGASPTVTAALNKLNEQIGARDYSGPYLADGQTVSASLQALSNAIAGANVVRYIERLSADLAANTEHTLPGGVIYSPDGLGNGVGLSVYTRGLLRDPGTVLDGDDYAETSTTSVTFYSLQKAGDHINYYVYG